MTRDLDSVRARMFVLGVRIHFGRRVLAGNGGVYVTERGARALYPGGPFLGRDNDHHEWGRGEPVEGPWS